MRILPVALGLLAVGSFLVATAPTSTAAAYCVWEVKEPIPYDDCDGLVCYGYTDSTGWQTCVGEAPYCLNHPCCYYEVGPYTFYYCPPPI